MLLTSILCVPFLVGLLCLFGRSRGLVESLNIGGFITALLLGVKLVKSVLGNNGAAVTEWNEFLRADSLSAWMVLLISIVSLATSRSEEHTSELQSQSNLVCRLLLEQKH